MIVFFEHGRVFEIASNAHEMRRLGHWRTRWVGKRLHATTESEQIAAFERAMERIYKKQGCGRIRIINGWLRLIEFGSRIKWTYPRKMERREACAQSDRARRDSQLSPRTSSGPA